MVDENLNTELPESSESNNSEPVQKSLTAEDVKAIINEIAPDLFHKLKEEIQKEQGVINKSILDKVNGSVPNFDLEKTLKHFLEVDLSDILIDYSFVANSRVRKQLVTDNILMEKHRVGLIDGTPNFYEFCKYAHSQVEELLNYYFVRRFPKIEDFNDHFNKFKPTYEDSDESDESFDSFNDITECSWFHKHLIFLSEKEITFKDKPHGIYASIRTNINKVRNKYLHRSSISSMEDDEIMSAYSRESPSVFASIKLKPKKDWTKEERELMKLQGDYFLIKKTIRPCNWNAVRNSIKDIIYLIKQDRSKFK